MKWPEIISQYMDTPEGKTLSANILKAKETATISPELPLLFRSYSEKLCPFDSTKIVIVGTEPNADPAIADGLCLSSRKSDYFLPETRIWYNWLKHACFPLMTIEQFKTEVASSDMNHLAKQGIVFTNEYLSTYSGRPGSHRNLGWHEFTQHMLWQVSMFKQNQNQPVMFVFMGNESGLEKNIINDKGLHLVVNIADPRHEQKYGELDTTTKHLFIVMSNFIAEYYPEQAKSYRCTFEDAFDWNKVESIWRTFVGVNVIPMPAIPDGISNKMRDAIISMSDKFDFYGTAGELYTPNANFKVGINYLIN